MIEQMRDAWLEAGFPYQDFWDVTVNEIHALLHAARRRREREFEDSRVLAYEQANLMAAAFHSPQDMPKYKPLSAQTSNQPSEADYERVRGYFMGLSERKSQ